jgi:hypothetical protein
MDSNLLFPSRPQPTTKQVSGHDFAGGRPPCGLAQISTWANMLSPDNKRAPEARKSLAHPEASNAKPEGWVRHKTGVSPVGATQEGPDAFRTANPLPSPKLHPTTKQAHNVIVIEPRDKYKGTTFSRAVRRLKILSFSPCLETPQGLKANHWRPYTARLKSCPDTCLSQGRQLVVAAHAPMIVIQFPAPHSPSGNRPALLRAPVPPWWRFSS